MITATLTPQEDGTLLLAHAITVLPVSRRTILANIRGRRVEVHVGTDCQLWYWNTYREAEDFDERVGQVTVAAHPAHCIQWLKSYTPRGLEQERLLDYYSSLHFQTFWQRQLAQWAAATEQWEQERQIEIAIWYAKEEERLNSLAEEVGEFSAEPPPAAVFEPVTLTEEVGEFPVEITFDDETLDIGQDL